MTRSTSALIHLVPPLAPASRRVEGATARRSPDPDAGRPGTSPGGPAVTSRSAAPDPVSDSGGRRLHLVGERGMVTAEYAVGLIAACAFAGVLLLLIKTGPILNLLTALAEAALQVIN